MKKMYLLYSKEFTNCPQLVGNSDNEICPQAVGDFIFSIPWRHHRILIDKYYEKGDTDTALFYAHKVVEEGWSRDVLAQYVLESSIQTIGVSEFQLTKFVPDEFKSSLPSIEDIETELK